MTLPTVPLIDGAYYWCRRRPHSAWEVAGLDEDVFWFTGSAYPLPYEHLAAISGPIPAPDEGGE